MSLWCRIVAALLAAGAGCDGNMEGDVTDSDSGADSDADTDTDSDAGADACAIDDWEWSSVAVPEDLIEPHSDLHLWVGADDFAVICAAAPASGWGGIAVFDGSAIAIEDLGPICNGVWGASPEQVWTFGEWDGVEGDDPQAVYHREGTDWIEQIVQVGAADCWYQAMFGTTAEDATLVGQCDSEPNAWRHESGEWVTVSAILPDADQLALLGVAVTPAANIFFGRGDAAGDGLFSDDGSDLDYPAAKAMWAGGAGPADLFALGDAGELLANGGGAWETLAECPVDVLYDWSGCWTRGAISPSGDVYLGGGIGGGDMVADDWRLHRYDGAELSRILEPCGGAEPRCGTEAVAIGDTRVFALVRQDWSVSLIWHDLPE